MFILSLGCSFYGPSLLPGKPRWVEGLLWCLLLEPFFLRATCLWSSTWTSLTSSTSLALLRWLRAAALAPTLAKPFWR